jgi:hypothetical protein
MLKPSDHAPVNRGHEHEIAPGPRVRSALEGGVVEALRDWADRRSKARTTM